MLALLPLLAAIEAPAAAAGGNAVEATPAPIAAEPIPTEPIIVTGERVKRSLKETTASVAVFRKQDLEAMAAPDRVQDVLALVPNVLIAGRRETPTIRGQGSAGVLVGLPGFLGGARPRTVVQVDGRTVTFNEFANSVQGLWDVDRVEVFRSPQTTTQGVNSIAGAIFIHTADPTYRAEGRVRAIGGDSRRRQLSGTVSAPLIASQLALRLSGDLYRSLSADTLSGPIAGVDLNDDRYDNLRAKLLAEPRGIPGLRLLLTMAHVQSQAPQIVSARPPFRQRRDDRYTLGYFKVTVNSATLAIDYAVTPSLAWRTTFGRGHTSFQRLAPQGFGQTEVSGGDRSLETIAEWKPGGAVGVLGGVSLLKTDLDQLIDLSATPFGTGSFKDRQISRGLFGEVTWRAAPRVTVIGGLRYESDTKIRTGVLRAVHPLPIDYDKTDRAVLPKFSIAYDVTDQLRLGVLVERAYNPGGVTLNPSLHSEVRFEPEYLWDFETFARASFLDGRLTVDGNLFYNATRNAQRVLSACSPSPLGCVNVSQVANAPRAHSYGAEIAVDSRLSDRLTVRAAIGLLGTRVTKTLTPDDPIAGKQFGGSPKLTGMAALDWRPVSRLRLSAQVRHDSGYFGDDANTPALRIKSSTTIDARASWDSGRFSLFGYARNLLDKFVITERSDPRDGPDAAVGTNDPRQLGIGVEARF